MVKVTGGNVSKRSWRDKRGRLQSAWGFTVSVDGKFLYALNNSDDHLYILEIYGGRAVARLNVGDHPLSAKLSKDGKTLYVANLGSASVAVVASTGDVRR